MVERREYMEKLMRWKDKRMIKVVTGVRRCGKSVLLEMFRNKLIENGIERSQCITINFESIESEPYLEYHALNRYILEQLEPGKMNYIFLDEIQLVPEFQRVVDSLYLRKDVDIYITGSNAKLLSGELATLLSGRYIEISMLPLSFKEYYEIVGGDRSKAFRAYYRDGGFPYATALENLSEKMEYLRGIYNTVLLKDLVERKRIADVPLMESITRYVADCIGSIISAKKITDTIVSSGRKVSVNTVSSYLQALVDAYILYPVKRFDIRGKYNLVSMDKYYLVDMGLRTLLMGERVRDIGRILENIIYLELIRRGYEVRIGKMNELEVDFIVTKDGRITYYQVASSILDETTYKREFAPLKAIKDNYPKYVLTMDEFPMGEDGIEQKNIIEFLLGE